ncbi:MAG: hypothetical protein KQ78_01817 [Candidatus Izimaplasma bacterium HR2]|nr:MAG: hypothetical protein KQ78_01817 [Candidatus Izimaplasma bacterium HR2]
MIKRYYLTKERYNKHLKTIKQVKIIGKIGTFIAIVSGFLLVIGTMIFANIAEYYPIFEKITAINFIINVIILTLLYYELTHLHLFKKLRNYKFLDVVQMGYHHLMEVYKITYLNYELLEEDTVWIEFQDGHIHKKILIQHLYDVESFPSDWESRYEIMTNEMEMHKICIWELEKHLRKNRNKTMEEKVHELWR